MLHVKCKKFLILLKIGGNTVIPYVAYFPSKNFPNWPFSKINPRNGILSPIDFKAYIE